MTVAPPGLRSAARPPDRQFLASRLPWPEVMGGLTVGAVSVISILLKLQVPTYLNTSGYDGLLFARNATRLAEGHWLGAFDLVTLAKGPGYPGFMAVVHTLGIPLALAEQVVYLLAVAALCGLVLAITRRYAVAVASFVFLALDPVNYGSASTDVMRDNFYASLSLFFVSTAAWAVLATVRRARISGVLGAAIVSGFAGGILWLTREEGPALFPPVVVLVALAWWFARTRKGGHAAPRRRLLRPLLALALAAVAFAVPLVTVIAINAQQYGLAATNDLGSGTFLRAYADWSRVEAGRQLPQVPINAAQRKAVYAVSPAARELEGDLERPDNQWRFVECPSGTCDYRGGWMTWAIREAAAKKGYFRTAQAAQHYFARLSEEIDRACSDGELTCRPRLPASVQSAARVPVSALVDSFTRLSTDLLASRYLLDLQPRNTDVPQGIRDEYTRIIDGLPQNNVAADKAFARFQDHRWQYEALTAVYRAAVPVLLVVAAAVALLLLLLRRRLAATRRATSWLLPVLAASLAAGLLVRLALLSVIDAAEYNAGLGRYQLPNHVFLMALLTVMVAVAAARLLDARRPPAGRASVLAGAADPDQAHREPDHGQLGASDDQHHAEDR